MFASGEIGWNRDRRRPNMGRRRFCLEKDAHAKNAKFAKNAKKRILFAYFAPLASFA
jgi:hypothetical protein